MTFADHADLLIEQLERDLAQEQTAAAYRQIEENLVRQQLKEILQIGINFLARAADDFERTHNDMTDGISDRGQ